MPSVRNKAAVQSLRTGFNSIEVAAQYLRGTGLGWRPESSTTQKAARPQGQGNEGLYEKRWTSYALRMTVRINTELKKKHEQELPVCKPQQEVKGQAGPVAVHPSGQSDRFRPQSLPHDSLKPP